MSTLGKRTIAQLLGNQSIVAQHRWIVHCQCWSIGKDDGAYAVFRLHGTQKLTRVMERQAHLVAIGLVFLGMAGFCCCTLNFELGTIHKYPASTILAIINNIRDTINTIESNVEYDLGQTATGYVMVQGILFTTRLYIFDQGYQFCSVAPSTGRIMGDALRAALRGLLQTYQGEMMRFAASHFLAIQGEYALQYFTDSEAPPAPPAPASMLDSRVGENNTTHDDHVRIIDGLPDPNSCWNVFKSSIVGAPEAVQHSTLYAGQIIHNSYYYLTMQADCNVVIYHATQSFWSSGTNGKAEGCRLRLQADGNLVIYSWSGDVVWASNVYCDPQPSCQITTIFTIEDDGIAVVYDTDRQLGLWATYP